MKEPTIKDVAARCQVSVSCVSYALRGHASIPPVTRARIIQAAAAIGYRPRPEIVQLMEHIRSGRTIAGDHPLAYVNPTDHPAFPGTDPVHAPLFVGASTYAQRQGYYLEILPWSQQGMTQRRLTSIMRARGIGGVIIPPLPTLGAVLEDGWGDFSIVTIGSSVHGRNISRIDLDHTFAMRMTLAHFSDLGYTRVGLIQPTGRDAHLSYPWHAAFLHYQSQFPAENRIPIFSETANPMPAFSNWVRHNRVDAIVTGNPAILTWLRLSNICVPDEVGVAFPANLSMIPEASGMDLRLDQLGMLSAEILIAALNRDEAIYGRAPRIALLEPMWRQGSTTRAGANIEYLSKFDCPGPEAKVAVP